MRDKKKLEKRREIVMDAVDDMICRLPGELPVLKPKEVSEIRERDYVDPDVSSLLDETWGGKGSNCAVDPKDMEYSRLINTIHYLERRAPAYKEHYERLVLQRLIENRHDHEHVEALLEEARTLAEESDMEFIRRMPIWIALDYERRQRLAAIHAEIHEVFGKALYQATPSKTRRKSLLEHILRN